jgi:hypothetical protein
MPFYPIAEIKSSRLHDFAAYLEGKRAGRAGALDRAEIDPVVDVPRLVGTILLLEQIRLDQPDAGRYRIRLVGSQLAAVAERDLTGRWLDEVGLPSNGDWPFDSLRTISAGAGLFSGIVDLPWEERSHVTIEWIATCFAPVPRGNDLIIFAFDKRSAASNE